MSRTHRAVAVALLSAGIVALTGSAVQAAPPAGSLGSLTVSPATGSDVTVPKVRTSAGCASGSDSYNAYVKGPGSFGTGDGFLIVGTQDVNFSTSAPFDVQLEKSLKDAAAELGTTVSAGEYDVTVNCLDSFAQEVKGTFTAALYFTSATAYQSTDPSSAVSTSTALSVSPAGSAAQGASVTLHASVTPAAAGGTVQFKDGAANLGTPAAVSGGEAQLATSDLAPGGHSLTAVFTSSSGTYTGSSSAAVSYQITTGTTAVSTTTALSVSPTGSVATGTPVSLTAAISPAQATGAVQFSDGGATLGSPVAVSNGEAAYSSSTLAAGSHSFTATFVPADAKAYTGSASSAVPLEITAPGSAKASQDIKTTVLSGELLISVASGTVQLPSPTLTTDGTLLATSGSLNPVTVTDTRAGNPGWNLSGQLGTFASGGAPSINAANLGWSPKVLNKGAGQSVTAGAAVDPAAGIAPGSTAPSGHGLATSRTLATAAPGAGIGTAQLGADLTLHAPTTTTAGTYTATLTLTAI